MLTEFVGRPRVAYFSMEIALRPECPTYAGGLGVLAGDVIRSAADLDLPLVAVAPVSRQGYFRQTLDAAGRQQESPDPWDPAVFAAPLGARVAIPLNGRRVWVGGWLYVHTSAAGPRVPVVLLDTDLPDNSPEDRALTDALYAGDPRHRLRQQAVLGIGGTRLLHALGFTIDTYHLNEGHSALLALELLRRSAGPPESRLAGDPPYDLVRVRERCIFTTHTPVEAAHDRYDYGLWAEVLGDFVDADVLRALAGRDELNMTRLAVAASAWLNGVAERHAETARPAYPGRRIHAITNGVHAATWTGLPFARLYDRYLPHWRQEPELLSRVGSVVPGAELWDAHATAKAALCDHVATATGVRLRPDRPILAYARRMTAYKRPELLLSDVARVRELARRQPFQLVYAGKAHPADHDGKRRIEEVHAALAALRPEIASAYLPNYGLRDAAVLVAGADVWLNTPLPPLEASGTSGMKAALNGVPSLSVLDGWWVEGCVEGVTGWGLQGHGGDGGAAAAELYERLERCVLPLLHGEPAHWLPVMQGAIALNGAMFHSHRMMRRYASEAYLK
ncbi:MAG: alpha-glucan family phosphorylase [Steroidobacteraceae bacterium]|nr:alpha-glucan family phosphorylase [Steroidobacteraceae bacterium]